MIESERGWGQKIDEIKEFPTREKALAFAQDYNKKHNNLPYVPDWYIKAVVQDEDGDCPAIL
jgi:hypothetical protein